MQKYIPKNLQSQKNSKILRKNMTKEERHLWYDFLNIYKPAFRRQFVILDYIVDFYCPSAKLAIEIDGSQHYESDNIMKDDLRTKKLESLGISVIRYTNLDIQKRFQIVCEDIDNKVKKRI